MAIVLRKCSLYAVHIWPFCLEVLLTMSWFKNKKKQFCVPEGHVVYAIGDIHGRDDLLTELIEKITEDFQNNTQRSVTSIVFLGDYVDRGLGSKAVIDKLLLLKKEFCVPGQGPDVYFLMGNHEEALLRFLDDPDFGEQWQVYGGTETLISYGITPPRLKADSAAWHAASGALGLALGHEHLAFLQGLRCSLEIGDYIFVHAGLRPGVALEEQLESDMLWIREEFLSDSASFTKKVVHGHSPKKQPFEDHRRIGVDTGAYITGVLTAVRLEQNSVSYLQTGL